MAEPKLQVGRPSVRSVLSVHIGIGEIEFERIHTLNPGGGSMHIDSPGLGALEVDTNKLIEFPWGIPGFESCKRFLFAEIGPAAHPFALFQGVDDPEAVFSVTSPESMGLHYEFELSEEEQALLAVESSDDIAVMLILRRVESSGDGDSKPPVQANLMAPLVINVTARKGLQKVIARLGCEVTLKPA